MSYHKLTRNIFFALFAGILVGALAPASAGYFSWLGLVFKLSLAMIVMPLIFTSIMDGMHSIGDIRHLGKMGSRTIAFYISTTFIAVFIGLVIVTTIQPGVRTPPENIRQAILSTNITSIQKAPEEIAAAMKAAIGSDFNAKSEKDIIKTLSALTEQENNDVESIKDLRVSALRLAGSLQFRARVSDKAKNTNYSSLSLPEFFTAQIKKALVNPFEALANKHVLAVILFALLLGGSLTTLGNRSETIFEINKTFAMAINKIVILFMMFAPFGVFGLIVDVVAATGIEVFQELGWYALCVVLGLGIHMTVVLPSILFLFTRKTPKEFFSATKAALMVAFSTSSSAATLPVNMQCVEEGLGVPKRVSKFVLSLGATINMDGTALYEAVAAVFIAQLYGVALTLPAQILIAFTAALAAIGAAGIPAAGTVTMAMVLSAVGLPLEGIGLLLAIDRPLDMCRTAVNVAGDGVAASVVAKLTGNQKA